MHVQSVAGLLAGVSGLPVLTVLRKYEDFCTTHRPHPEPGHRSARCEMASPAWTTSAFGGATTGLGVQS